MRRVLLLGIDLFWVVLSTFGALWVRDNFTLSSQKVEVLLPYALITVFLAAGIFYSMGLHRAVWRFTGLPDILRVMTAVTLVLLGALLLTFWTTRLEGVARSIPLIQWFLLVGAMSGTRILVRLIKARRRARKRAAQFTAEGSEKETYCPLPGREHVLVIGLSNITELYISSVAEFAAKRMSIVGILADNPRMRGRMVRNHKVLGSPSELLEILAEYEVHGVSINRIVIVQPFEKLSPQAQAALLQAEKTRAIKLDFFAERLGLLPQQGLKHQAGRDTVATAQAKANDNFYLEGEREGSVRNNRNGHKNSVTNFGNSSVASRGNASLGNCGCVPHDPLGAYGPVKRAMDMLGAVVLMVLLAPVAVIVALLVALDVGLPILFWQQRPGRLGQPFYLYKFRTLRGAHDAQGNLIADEDRSSAIGRFLRRTRLDELPQLFNVFIGDMSFVGPRPLLPRDLPRDPSVRLSVRPGITGWAQINGGNRLSIEDKAALDAWYIANASLRLDLYIMFRTLIVAIRGEESDPIAIRMARLLYHRQQRRKRQKFDDYCKTKGAQTAPADLSPAGISHIVKQRV